MIAPRYRVPCHYDRIHSEKEPVARLVRDLVGFADSSGVVFVDQSAQKITAADPRGRVQRCWITTLGRSKMERTVRPVFVVGT